MKHFLIALALFLGQLPFISPAYAESWKLFSSKNWNVYYSIVDNGRPFCAANSTFFRGESVSLINYGYGPVLQIYAANANFDGILGQADIWVDNHTYWRGAGKGVGDAIFFEDVHQELIEEMFTGNWLYVDLDMDGYSDTSYSLQGSAKAFYVLAECIRRLN